MLERVNGLMHTVVLDSNQLGIGRCFLAHPPKFGEALEHRVGLHRPVRSLHTDLQALCGVCDLVHDAGMQRHGQAAFGLWSINHTTRVEVWPMRAISWQRRRGKGRNQRVELLHGAQLVIGNKVDPPTLPCGHRVETGKNVTNDPRALIGPEHITLRIQNGRSSFVKA